MSGIIFLGQEYGIQLTRSSLNDNKVVRGSCLDYSEVVHGRCPWTMTRSGRFNRPYNGQTNMQHLGKSNMLRSEEHTSELQSPA